MSGASSTYWRHILGIDLRSLALLRVGLGLSMLGFLASLWPEASVFLSDQGIYTRRDALAPGFDWSLYFINGHMLWAHFLLLLTLIAALLLMLGYRTRFMTILCWVLIGSLTARARMTSSGADMQLTLMLFWSMFLPLGARFSVDSALNSAPKPPALYVSWATLAAMLQVAYLYFFGALLKTGSIWHESFDSIYLVLHTHDINSALAQFVPEWPGFLRGLTAYVYYLELCALFLLFSPIKNAWCRLIVVPLLMLLHVGFGLFLAISYFPIISIAALSVFVPGLFWDKIIPVFNARATRRGITLYYDRDCRFCFALCRIFRALGLPGETRILPAQDVAEIHALMQKENSWVVEDAQGVRHVRWQAVAWVMRRSPVLWPIGILFKPRVMDELGDALYGMIAHHRPKLGALFARFAPDTAHDLAPPLSAKTNALIAFLMALVLVWNINSLSRIPAVPLPDLAHAVVTVAKLGQNWSLFAPEPRSVTLWHVVEGQLADGRTVDLLHRRMKPARHEIPDNGYSIYPSHRWHKFLGRAQPERHQELMARFFCQRYDTMRPTDAPPIASIIFTIYRQKTAKPDDAAYAPEKVAAFTQPCRSKMRAPEKREAPMTERIGPQELTQPADADASPETDEKENPN